MTNKLPLNWCECKLEDVCSLENGIKSTDLNLPLLDAKYLRGKKEAEYRNNGVILNSGDYVILVDGENSGEIFSIPQKGIMGSTFKLLNFTSFCEKKYVLYFIHSYQDLFRTNKKGAAIPHLNKEIFKNLEVPVPPLAEQGRIVEKIEEIFAKIDAGVEKLKSAQEKIKQYKQSVLHSAFTGKLYKTTEWKNAELKDVCKKITDGSHNPPGKQYSGIPMLSGQNIKNNRINFDDFRFISEKDYEFELKRTPIESGDILLTIVGTIGQSAVVPEQISPFAIQRSVALIKPAKDILSLFIKYYFDSPIAKSFFKIKERGTAQKGIYLNTLKELIITIPTIPEQKKIVEEIEKRFTKADKMLDAVEKSLQLSEQLKQSVLKKAFEGKLVPQDPNDEPASVLLDRIKSEKQQNEKAKGKKK